MTATLHHSSYEFEGQSEPALCFGRGHSRQILIVPPLFDEMNRVRRMLVQAMRALDGHAAGSVLIDLPGCGESAEPLSSQTLTRWRDAVASAAEQIKATHVASLRGGALIDDGATGLPRWRLAPVKGASLLKTMIRTRIAGAKEEGVVVTEAELMAVAELGPIALAGNHLGPDMVAQLAVALPSEAGRMIERKLGQDFVGSPLWMRAEPQDDAAMSANIAADWDRWSATCGG